MKCGVGHLWAAVRFLTSLSTPSLSNLCSVLQPQGGITDEAEALRVSVVDDQVERPEGSLIVEFLEHILRTWSFSLGVSEVPECVCDIIIV